MSTPQTIEALTVALAYLEDAAKPEQMYGHYHGGDPRRFSPAEDECSPEEIAAHKAACEAWERGERPDIRKACEPNREPVSYIDEKTGQTETIEAGAGLALYAPFGIGVNTYIDDDAVKVRDLVRAALSALTPAP